MNITGDGVSTVAQLVVIKNESRALNPYVGAKQFTLTSEMQHTLLLHGYDKNSVLPAGVNVELLPVANIGTGGDSKDVTDDVHPGFMEVAVHAAESIPHAFFVGVDLIAPDISSAPQGQEYAIPEINVRADIALHHFPVFGTPRDVAGVLIESMFPRAKIVPHKKLKRCKLVLRGKVINVGMRKWVEQFAVRNHITGWVKNSGDSVEAVICGSGSSVERLLERLNKRKATAVTSDDWVGEIPDDFRILT